MSTMSTMWVDKYKPDTFQRLNYHEDITKRLKTLVSFRPKIE